MFFNFGKFLTNRLLQELLNDVARLERKLDYHTKLLKRTRMDIREAFAKLRTEVSEFKTVADGAKAMIHDLSGKVKDLSDKLTAAIGEKVPDGLAEEMAALAAEMDANAGDLASALVTGTPAEEVEPPVETPVEEPVVEEPAPVEEPVVETPVEETPVEETPSEEPPAEPTA